jgi:hypothetical protein
MIAVNGKSGHRVCAHVASILVVSHLVVHKRIDGICALCVGYVRNITAKAVFDSVLQGNLF